MNMDGSGKVLLADTSSRYLTSFYVQEGNLYYVDTAPDSSINKITKNGMIQQVHTVKNGFIQILGIVDQQIYFVSSTKDSGDMKGNCILYRINTDGTNPQKIE